jgi:hypothetical protein
VGVESGNEICATAIGGLLGLAIIAMVSGHLNISVPWFMERWVIMSDKKIRFGEPFPSQVQCESARKSHLTAILAASDEFYHSLQWQKYYYVTSPYIMGQRAEWGEATAVARAGGDLVES